MRTDARKYRDDMYRLRAHPGSDLPEEFYDKRNSFARVYLSILPFLVLEYFVELRFAASVSGLVFPVGFLLYWAFYYTYYRPGLLEEKLANVDTTDWSAIPRLIIGVAIWFVKVTVVELFRLATAWLHPAARVVTPEPKPKLVYARVEAPRQAPRPQRPAGPPPLPAGVMSDLQVLGMGDCRDWKQIHHRYRELAKKYHPDLNPEITHTGQRFMRFDAAYKRLAAFKGRYFKE